MLPTPSTTGASGAVLVLGPSRVVPVSLPERFQIFGAIVRLMRMRRALEVASIFRGYGSRYTRSITASSSRVRSGSSRKAIENWARSHGCRTPEPDPVRPKGSCPEAWCKVVAGHHDHRLGRAGQLATTVVLDLVKPLPPHRRPERTGRPAGEAASNLASRPEPTTRSGNASSPLGGKGARAESAAPYSPAAAMQLIFADAQPLR
jgi:hypothetical protein